MSDEIFELDARGLLCPLPLLKAKQALNKLPAGARLRVLATDPGSQRDFQVFSQQSGHPLLEVAQQDACFSFLLQKQ